MCFQEEIIAVETMREASDQVEYSFGSFLDKQKGKNSSEDAKINRVKSGRSAFSFQIRTLTDGFNSGRTYYLHSNSAEACKEVVGILRMFVEIARRRAEKYSKFRESKRWLRSIYDSNMFQLSSSFLIVLVTAITKPYVFPLDDPDRSSLRRISPSASLELKSQTPATTPSGC